MSLSRLNTNVLESHTDVASRIESNFVMIVADLPILRPVFLFLLGHSATGQGRHPGQRRNRYKLYDITMYSSHRVERGPKGLYPTDTIDLVPANDPEPTSPPNRIRRTPNMHISHHGRDDQPDTKRVSMHAFGEF